MTRRSPTSTCALPTSVADVRLLSELASTYGVTNPINRVLSAIGIPD